MTKKYFWASGRMTPSVPFRDAIFFLGACDILQVRLYVLCVIVFVHIFYFDFKILLQMAEWLSRLVYY